MLLEDLECIIPPTWQPMDLIHEKCKIIKLPSNSLEYIDVMRRVEGNYYSFIKEIYKLQNPLLYAKYKLKQYEYEKRGPYQIKILFHDTAFENMDSISLFNLDWRYGERYMFGPGVYFSISPYLANKHSSKSKGLSRAMILSEVLTQNVQIVNGEIFLPDFNYDTVLCHKNETVVKYFDSEYYPQYFVEYVGL